MKAFWVVCFLISLSFLYVFSLPSKSLLKVVICDVGQGDAILVSVGNWQALVDGGPDNSVLLCLGRHMSIFDREIELVVLTHPQLDHFGGLIDVLDRYKVRRVIANPVSEQVSPEYGIFEEKLSESLVNIEPPKSGPIISGLLNGYVLSTTKSKKQLVGFSSDPNILSIVTLFAFGENSILLTGDLDPETSQKLIHLNRITRVDLLKVPHHGSRNGLTRDFLNKTNPRMAAISCGLNNQHGHPHKEVVSMLEEFGVEVSRTDLDGEIVYVSDGKNLKRVR